MQVNQKRALVNLSSFGIWQINEKKWITCNINDTQISNQIHPGSYEAQKGLNYEVTFLSASNMQAPWSTIKVGGKYSRKENLLPFKTIDYIDPILNAHIQGAHMHTFVKCEVSMIKPVVRSSAHRQQRCQRQWQHKTENSWLQRPFGIYAKWANTLDVS